VPYNRAFKAFKGPISPPAGFSWTPSFTIFESRPGVFSTNINEKALRPTTTATVYVDVATGADTNPGTNPLLPKKSIWSAINRGLNDFIYVKTGVYTQNYSWFALTPLQDCVIVGVDNFTDLNPAPVTTTVNAGNINGKLSVNKLLHVENFIFLGGAARNFLMQNGSANFINCEFQSSESLEAFGLSSVDAGVNHVVQFIRCKAINAYNDGFCLTNIGAGSTCKWLELNCISTLNGKAAGTQQASTTHWSAGNGTISVIRINGIYYNCWGPQLIADVGGVESWNLGVIAHTINGSATSTAFYNGNAGTMWLHSCQPYANIDLQTDAVGGTIKVHKTVYKVHSGTGSVVSYNP